MPFYRPVHTAPLAELVSYFFAAASGLEIRQHLSTWPPLGRCDIERRLWSCRGFPGENLFTGIILGPPLFTQSLKTNELSIVEVVWVKTPTVVAKPRFRRHKGGSPIVPPPAAAEDVP
jgi:hypothetical protein